MRRVGFDIDGTLTNFEKFVFSHAVNYMKRKYNMNVVNSDGYDVDKAFDIENQLIERGYSKEEANLKATEILNTFWEKYYPEYILTPFRDGVKETINRLYEDGNEIFIISSRKKSTENTPKGKFVKGSISFQLLFNQIKYHHLLLFENDEQKLQAIKDNYIDIMADDKPELLSKIAEFTDAVCINSAYNIKFNLPNNVKRANNYVNNEVYDIISSIIKESNEPILDSDSLITGVPSIDKLWLRNYTKGDLKWSLQKMSPYDRMTKTNASFKKYKITSYYKTPIINEEFTKKVNDCAKKLNADGIIKGDIVPLLVVNTPETVIMITALMKLMVTIVPISPADSTISIENKLSKLNSKKQIKVLYIANHFIAKENQFATDKINPIVEKLNINKIIYSSVEDSMPLKETIGYKIKINNRKPLLNDKYISMNNYIASGNKIENDIDLEYKNDYTAVIIYTGGTVQTKGVMLSPDNLDAEIRHFLNTRIGIKRNEKISGILPYDHIYGLLINLIVPIAKGMEVVQRPKPEREKLDELIVKEKVNYFATIPVLLNEVLKNKKISKSTLSHVKQVFSGSEAISDTLLKQIKDFFAERGADINIIDGYGASELTAMCLENGVPIISATPKIVGLETEKELSYNKVGELCISGDTVMQGYFDNEEKTKEVLKIHEDGKVWLHTGDLAYIDETGKVVPQGRIDQDIIKVNSQMVNLFAISKMIEKHPCVQKCIVMKYPSEKKGTVPVAFIEINQDFIDDENIKDSIIKLCQKSLTYYEIPENFIFINNIPLTTRGKVDRNKLLEVYDNEEKEKVMIKQRVITYSK